MSVSIVTFKAKAPAIDFRWEFHSATEFSRFSDTWDYVNEEASGVPVLGANFVASLLKEFGTPRDVLVIGYHDNTVIAIAVLTQNHNSSFSTFQPAQAPIGAWIHKPPYTFESLVPSLFDKLPGFALTIGITQQDSKLTPRPNDGPAVQTLDYIQTAWVPILGSFDAYWAARGKNLRNNTKRQRSRLEKDGVTLQLETITAPEDVAQAIADYGCLESAGWKGTEGTAIHPDNAQGRFYRSLLESYCRAGAGRIYRYRYGESVVAVDLCIANRDTLVVLKTTYDETIKSSSPASLMRFEYFRNLFSDEKIKRIEFYGRVMDWHTKWTNDLRTMYHVNFFRWPFLLAVWNTVHRHRKLPEQTNCIAALDHETETSTPPVHVDQPYVVTIFEDVTALPERFIELFNHVSKSSVFFTFQWYLNFAQLALGANNHLRIYAVDTAATSISARAILLMKYSDTVTKFFSAATLSGLSNYYTSLFGPLADPARPCTPAVLDKLAAAITSDECRWNVIDLHPLAVDDVVFPGLVSAFRKSGFIAKTYFCFGNWYLQVNDRSYEDYFKSLPSKIRNTVRKKREQVEKAGKAKFAIYSDSSELEIALRAYEQVYAGSWKESEPYPEFIRGLCRICASSKWLRLGIIYLDERPIAAQIWIVHAGVASIYKLAYDSRYAKLSPGTLLTAHLMERVINIDKVREVDYLTGDDPYKKDWMSHRRERWGIRAFNPRTPQGLLAVALHVGARAMRRLLGSVRVGN
jgi:CelD/BcsL family acetyltransferase involved in cellulose biosynthesis